MWNYFFRENILLKFHFLILLLCTSFDSMFRIVYSENDLSLFIFFKCFSLFSFLSTTLLRSLESFYLTEFFVEKIFLVFMFSFYLYCAPPLIRSLGQFFVKTVFFEKLFSRLIFLHFPFTNNDTIFRVVLLKHGSSWKMFFLILMFCFLISLLCTTIDTIFRILFNGKHLSTKKLFFRFSLCLICVQPLIRSLGHICVETINYRNLIFQFFLFYSFLFSCVLPLT